MKNEPFGLQSLMLNDASNGVGAAAVDDDAGNDENEPHCNLIPVCSPVDFHLTHEKNNSEWKSLVIIMAVDVLFALTNTSTKMKYLHTFCTHLEIFVPRNQGGVWGLMYIVTWIRIQKCETFAQQRRKKAINQNRANGSMGCGENEGEDKANGWWTSKKSHALKRGSATYL